MNLRHLVDSAKSLKISLIVVGVLSIVFVIFGLLIGLPPFGYVLIVGIVAIPTLVDVGRSIRGGSNKLTDARFLLVLCASILVMLIAIQAVPYGRAHSNPPITGEPQWSSPRTRELMVPRVPTHQELAIMINASRETVTRAFQVLFNQGVLLRDGDDLKVMNEAMLRNIADGRLEPPKT